MAEQKVISKINIGTTTYKLKDSDAPAAIVFDGTYNPTTNKAATVSTVTDKIDAQKGANNGLASLDSSGKVPSGQLPSYVDDVLEYESKSAFPSTGEAGKIYVDKSANLTYRWSGSAYVEISPSLALGEISSTAYRGDRGKTAYDHSQSTHARTDATAVTASSTNGNIKINGTETNVYTHPGSGTNPHGTTKSDVGLGNVGNFKAVSTVANQDLSATEKSNARANIGAGTSNVTIGTGATQAAAGNHNHDGTYLKTTDISDWAKASSKPSYTAAEVGLGNVGNYKAVSTVANQGLTDTEKSNARTNIGAGTSNLTIGTTGSTAAAGNHTHDYSNTYAAKSHTHTVSQITDFPSSMPASDVSAWAKASSKPSYTYSEVGAASSSHSHDVVSSGTSTLTGGFMSQADKKKLDGIAEGATANVGTITGIKMNGSSKGSSGVVDLGTVITEHQDISGKAEKSTTVTNVAYDATNHKITKTINGTTSDVVTVATLKTDLGSMPASDVSAWAKASTKPSYTASEVGAATSGHTHTTSLASDTGTSTITLASAGKYKLTAGGTSVVFTMPTIPTVNYPVTSVNSKTGAVSLTASDVGASASGHTHTTDLATSTGTSAITLAANSKYQLTAGGTSVIFTTPSNPDYSNTYAPKSHTHTKSQITDFPTSMPASDVSAWAKAASKPSYTASEVGAIATTLKGANSGVAELDATGKVPSSQLPSFVDDVLEYDTQSSFPTTGEAGKIYIAKDTNKTYRWGGSSYVSIASDLALGETSSTAYRGDRGKTAYDHSQATHARTDATAVSSSSTNGNIKINGTETTVYSHPTTTAASAAAVKVGKDSQGHVVIGNALTASDVGAATSGHTHTTSLATDTGTSSITLASAGKYKLTAGGNSVIFTMPTIPTVSYPVTSVNTKTGAVSLTYSDVGAASSGHTHTASEVGAATSDHTHTTSLASDTGTSSITLASAGKYKLTAGGNSVIFTMPTIPTVSYPVTSVAGKTGAVTLTSSDVGLGSVGNFKAVSTVANQGLTDTEKSNARTNIGAGTSSLTIGTTSTTAAAGDHTHSGYVPTTRTVNNKALSGNISLTASDVGASASDHTHTLSMVTSSGTSSIDLAANTKYQLTAGGSTYIFKTPAAGSSTDSYHTSGSWSGLTYTATAVGNAGALAFTIPTGTSSTTVAAGNHTHSDYASASHTHPYDDNYKFVLSTSDALYTAINSAGWTSSVIV